MKDNKENQGWICPCCHVVNSPDIKQCDCVREENTKSTRMEDINEA